jgi:hypothetical protein
LGVWVTSVLAKTLKTQAPGGAAVLLAIAVHPYIIVHNF